MDEFIPLDLDERPTFLGCNSTAPIRWSSSGGHPSSQHDSPRRAPCYEPQHGVRLFQRGCLTRYRGPENQDCSSRRTYADYGGTTRRQLCEFQRLTSACHLPGMRCSRVIRARNGTERDAVCQSCFVLYCFISKIHPGVHDSMNFSVEYLTGSRLGR